MDDRVNDASAAYQFQADNNLLKSGHSYVGENSVQSGYKLTELGSIPEDWEVIALGDIATIHDGTHQTPSYVPYGIPFYSVEHVTSRDFSNTKYISKEEHLFLTRSFKIEKNDVLMTRIGSIGDCVLVDWDVDASFYVSLALLKIYGAESSYIAAYSESATFKNEVDLHSLPSATPRKINLGPISDVRLLLPKVPAEQRAIASVLFDINALIDSIEALIAKKQAIKTATMQQLLTGRTRLPQFAHRPDGTLKSTIHTELGEIPEDWEVGNIGDLISITTGDKNTQDRVVDGLYPFFVRSQNVEKINTYSFDGEGVLTAGDGVGTGKIFHYINGKFDFHQRVYLMHNFGEKLDGYYFYIFFSNHFYDRIMSMTAKSSVDSVRREMIAEMLITLPPMLEQKAIAITLSDIDNEIQTLEQRLSKTRLIKLGMMQELLTGKTRLL